jgi:hypothetical protein
MDDVFDVDIFSEDIRDKLRAAYLILMQNGLNLSKLPAEAGSPLLPPRELALRVLRLESLGNDTAVSLWQYREQLTDGLKSMLAAQYYLRLVWDYVFQNSMITKLKNLDIPEADPTHLFTQLVDRLVTKSKGEIDANGFEKALRDKDTSVEVQSKYIAEFISLVPLRITAARYYDYIRDALAIPEGLSMLTGLEQLKRMFCPMDYCVSNFGFEKIKETLDHFWLTAPDADFDMAKVNLREIEAAGVALDNMTQHINMLFDMVDAAYLTAQHGEKYGSPWTDGEMDTLRVSCQDALENRLSEDKQKAVAATVDDALNKILRKIEDTAHRGSFRDFYRINKAPAEIKTVLLDWENITDIFYETGMDFLTPGLMDDDDIDIDGEDMADGLIEYITSVTQGLPAAQKRFLRQHFLRQIPYPYDLEEFRRYFLDTYDSLDKAGKLIMAQMVYIYEENAE